MTNEDYRYLYSKLPNTKIPKSIQEKIDKGKEFTVEEERTMLQIINLDKIGNEVKEE